MPAGIKSVLFRRYYVKSLPATMSLFLSSCFAGIWLVFFYISLLDSKRNDGSCGFTMTFLIFYKHFFYQKILSDLYTTTLFLVENYVLSVW